MIAVLFLFSKMAFADYDVAGRWLLEGGGFAQKDFLRVKLTDEGVLDIQTQVKNEVLYVSEYSVNLRLDASRLGINAWKYSENVRLQNPIRIPDLDPTLNDPFKLPRVTVDKMTYEVVFTSTTSGTVNIYGKLDVDVVGEVEIDSVSAIWKEGTKKPDIPDMTSGCSAGIAWTALALGVPLALSKTRKFRGKNTKLKSKA
jgi:Synergist-CTERM protein sorting domain-containing protein